MQIYWYIFILKNLLFRPTSVYYYYLSMRNSRLERRELILFNNKRRRDIVRYAFNNVPFYKEFYLKEGFDPNRLDPIEHWESIPILEKNHIRNHLNSLKSDNVPKQRFREVTTGGSTGEPLKLYRDRGFSEEIIKWRMLGRWGRRPSDSMLMLWRRPTIGNRYYDWINEAIWWPTKRYKYDVSCLDDGVLAEIVGLLEKKKPRIIWGYVGAVEELSLYLHKKKLKLNYKPLVWTTAAPLSSVQKKLISSTLSSDILDQYACSEVHWVASSVPERDYLLVDEDFRHVDIVNNKRSFIRDNVEGDVLISDLMNKAFPLIKYRVGDRSAFMNRTPSKYGFFTQIKPVKGRTSDILRFPNNVVLTGEYLTTIFDSYSESIKQFQIIQEKDYSIRIKVVPVKAMDYFELNQMVNPVVIDLQKKIGELYRLKIEMADNIESDRGKIRYVISKVN